MTESEGDALALMARVAQLERRLRRMAWVVIGGAVLATTAIGLVAIIVAAVITGAKLPGLGHLHLAGLRKSDVVKATRFEVVNHGGGVLATFGLSKTYGLSLVFDPGFIHPSVVLKGNPHPSLELRNIWTPPSETSTLISVGNIRLTSLGGAVSLVSRPMHDPGLSLSDSAGKVRGAFDLSRPLVDLGTTSGPRLGQAEPELTLADAQGTTRGSFDLAQQLVGTPSGMKLGKAEPELTLSGARALLGWWRGAFGIDSDGEPKLVLNEKGSVPSRSAEIKPSGLRLLGAGAKDRLAVGSVALTSKTQGGTIITPPSSITAFDKKGKVIGRWPSP